MKNLRNFLVLFTIVAGAVGANAQAVFHANFQLTDETRWGKAVFPAGNYSLTIDSTLPPARITIRAADGKTAAVVFAKTSADAAPGGSYLFITGSGADRIVRSLNLPDLGRSLVYEPLSESEREKLYATASQTVPLLVAKK